MRRPISVLAWCAALAASLVVLHGPLVPDAPEGWSLSSLNAYITGRGPDAAVMALVWLIALVAAWYLAVVTALGLAARLSRASSAVAVLDRISVPLVRRLLGTWLAISAVSGSATSAWAAPSKPAPVVMVMESAPGNAPISMTLEAPVPVAPEIPSTAEHVVQSGEHFWSIAEAHLTQATGRSPSDRDVARYWQRLVAANTAQLRVPSNPDLLYPGQRLVLPQPQ